MSPAARLDPFNAFLFRPPQEDGIPVDGPLAGMSVAVKDNIHVKDMPMTCGSRILSGYTAPYDATVVARLRTAGAVIAGKTNLDEFGFGSSGEHSAYGPTDNPLAADRVPGGSSSGSAAAVAAGMVPAALGSDTGGSVRQPAAFCGLVGFCPSWGTLSRYGLTAFASSLDRIGILASDVSTVLELFTAMSGPDPLDATCTGIDLKRDIEPVGGPGNLTVGIDASWNSLSEPDVTEQVELAMETLRFMGAAVRPVMLPDPRDALAVYHVVAASEASSNLQRFDGLRFGPRHSSIGEARARGFGREAKRRILMGAWCLSAGYGDSHYRAAIRGRSMIRTRMAELFGSVDLVLTPTTPTGAFRFGEHQRPSSMYQSDLFTVTASLAGIPAISLPVGMNGDGLPVGIQLMAGRFNEMMLLDVAKRLQRKWKQEGDG